jgi:hypothetical protein
MNGLGGVADAAGEGAGVGTGAGLGAATPEGAVLGAAGVEAVGAGVCAGAPQAKNGALISAPAIRLRNFIRQKPDRTTTPRSEAGVATPHKPCSGS